MSPANEKLQCQFESVVRQGNIYKDVLLVELIGRRSDTDEKRVEDTPYKFIISLSQECDLDQDFNKRTPVKETSTATKTQSGIGRIQKTVTQTQSAKGNIRNTTTQTQTGKSNIRATTTKNQSGRARITATTTKTQTGKGNIRATATQTITGKANIDPLFTPMKTTSLSMNDLLSQSIGTTGNLIPIDIITDTPDNAPPGGGQGYRRQSIRRDCYVVCLGWNGLEGSKLIISIQNVPSQY